MNLKEGNKRVGARAVLQTLVLVLLAVCLLGADEGEKSKTAQVEAAFVYNFVKYTTWPKDTFQSNSSPIVIGLAGSEKMYDALKDTVKDKVIGERSINVIRLSKPVHKSDDDEAYQNELEAFKQQMFNCQVVCFGPDEFSWTQDLYQLSDLSNHTLTVGDGESYLDIPTMLDLVLDDGRIVFYANRKEIEKSRLKMSSKLLRLARESK